ncbi:hypothetical protein Salat_1133100 [Sesamum alatum]|uniref:Uncharacterized protein n=1 Tax=Sesamum alatum TaxID=300844 RepID=A0AAE1YDM1_9LAMI|nr:hypothetical protein Salat_1133100 [Sesamum alatum]
MRRVDGRMLRAWVSPCVRQLGGLAGERGRCVRDRPTPTVVLDDYEKQFQTNAGTCADSWEAVVAVHYIDNSRGAFTAVVVGLVEGRVISIIEDVSILTDVVDMKFVALKDEVNLPKHAVRKEEDRAPQSKTELRRRCVKDLSSAIVAADMLVDFGITNNSDPDRKKKDFGREKGKSSKTGKDGKFKKKKKEVTVSGDKETVQPVFDKSKKACYLCNNDHCMRDCPKRGKLNTLVAKRNDDDEGGSTQVNPLQLLSAL